MTLGSSTAGTGFTLGGLATQTTAAQQPMGGFSFGAPKVQAASVAPAQPTPALSLGAQPTGHTELHMSLHPLQNKRFVAFSPCLLALRLSIFFPPVLLKADNVIVHYSVLQCITLVLMKEKY